jgi:uncharacterized repeat protein (TIGR04076 family)
MAERYGVKITITSQKGNCVAGHRLGDEFVIQRHTPPGLCLFAYSAIDPDIRTLMFGGTYPWCDDKDTYVGCCPDPVNPVVFELRRIPFEEES